MTEIYDIGDAMRLVARFTDEDGEPADPTEVLCKIRTPREVVTEYADDDEAMTNPDVGTWKLAFAITEPGVWSYRWEGSGAVTQAFDGQFFAPDSILADVPES